MCKGDGPFPSLFLPAEVSFLLLLIVFFALWLLQVQKINYYVSSCAKESDLKSQKCFRLLASSVVYLFLRFHFLTAKHPAKSPQQLLVKVMRISLFRTVSELNILKIRNGWWNSVKPTVLPVRWAEPRDW